MPHYTHDPAADAKADGITFTAEQGAWLSHHLRNALCGFSSRLLSDRDKSYARCIEICNAVDKQTESKLARQMAARCEWNVNSYVRFRLTDHGRKCWAEEIEKERRLVGRTATTLDTHDPHGEIRMQGHTFMQLLGRHIESHLMGCPFETDLVLEDTSPR